MNKFKVVEIVNSTTIRVSPRWKFPKADGTFLRSDLFKIAGLHVDDNFLPVKKRLEIFLPGKEIEAYNATFTVNQVAPIECEIFLNETDIVFFFPEYQPA